MDTLRTTDLPPEALQLPTEPVSFRFQLFLTLVVVSNLITSLPVLQLLLPAQVALLFVLATILVVLGVVFALPIKGGH